MNGQPGERGEGLLQQAGLGAVAEPAGLNEQAWIDVIRKMDAVYADLLRYQVELEKKNAELEQTQHFIASVLSAMTDVLIVCDTRARILEVNKALEQITGHGAADLIGRPLGDLFGAESRQMAESFSSRLDGETLIDCEVEVQCADGSTAPLAMNCSPRHDADGRLAGLVIIGRPVGELRRAYAELDRAYQQLQQAQRQLVQSEKMASLGRLVAGVAHELNNPISFVFGNMHALKRYGERIHAYLEAVDRHVDDGGLADLREKLRIDHILADMGSLIDGTLEGAERVSLIVQDLRRYSGSQREPESDCDLVEVMRKALDWVGKAARIRPEVILDLPEHCAWRGRKGAVQQVLVNLIQNAMDAMTDVSAPRLELGVAIHGERIRLTVADNGHGIAPEDRDKLFDPFFTRKPVGQGTGLGLYVSYGIAQDLGGDLRADNRETGGAVFTLELPGKREEGA